MLFPFDEGTFICSSVPFMKLIEVNNINCRRYVKFLRKFQLISIIIDIFQNSTWTHLIVLEFVVSTLRKSLLPQVIHDQITLLEYLMYSMLIFSFLITVIAGLEFLFTRSCNSCILSKKSFASTLFFPSKSDNPTKSTTPFGKCP
jgi:hypothetical protein